MTLKIGRVNLTSPNDVEVETRPAEDPGVAGPWSEDSYGVSGRATGASAQATAASLLKEGARFGCVYVEDDAAAPSIPAGHYRLASGPRYAKPRGAPGRRPWDFTLARKLRPVIVRQAEDDNVAGVDTADVDADEALKVVYTATASEVLVLDPRNVAGAEKLNLPTGDWKILARVQSRTTVTQRFRCKLQDLAGADIATGAQVTVGAGNGDAWTLLDLGTLTVPTANDKANWFVVSVHANVDLNAVWIDSVRIVPA